LSLGVARTYLKAFKLKVPAYVLLLTDGLPNCNLALNAATCPTTTPGCKNTNTCSGGSCCGLGAKDCLDDSATRQAAASLLADGFKVYVVGFGASATGNNQAVLDNIAAAGGTGKAHAATNHAALINALNAVAFNATTCCKDVCTAGATQCASTGEVRKCVMDASIGCTNWNVSACPAKSACFSGACQSCADACTLGSGRCAGSSAQKCVAGPVGCTEWKEVAACAYGEVCAAGACKSCEACSNGDKRCVGNDAESCARDLLTGCTAWTRTPCASGTLCATGVCQSCTKTCAAGYKRCSGATPETCLADARGCTAWKAGSPCTTFCSGGACGSCGTTCTVGVTRCNGGSVEVCAKDSTGCTVWQGKGGCAAREACISGRCEDCPVDCGLATKRCAGNTVEECRLGTSGCREWVRVNPCATGETCAEGSCLTPCTDACAEGEGRCDASSRPQKCQRAANGCTAWSAAPPCDTSSACVKGACLLRCSEGEVETCAPGYVCTGLPEGKVCVPNPNPNPNTNPGPSDGGTVSGPGERDPIDEPLGPGEVRGLPQGAPAGACGCGASGSEGILGMGLLPLLGLRRSRMRAR
jgi:hypothetical protein